MHKKNSHEFALYTSDELQKTLVITDRDLLFRIQQVLRLTDGDTIIFFNDLVHARATLIKSDKKTIQCALSEAKKNSALLPRIHWLLPVLERDAFEAALSHATVLGATSITPLITEKSRKQWGSDKDVERARRIMIAAAEQSKQYVLPQIVPAQHLTVFIEEQFGQAAQSARSALRIFFDPTGAPCSSLIAASRAHDDLFLCIGPEGDMTEQEKALLTQAQFTFYALTPSILRACDAVMVAQGIIRALV